MAGGGDSGHTSVAKSAEIAFDAEQRGLRQTLGARVSREAAELKRLSHRVLWVTPSRSPEKRLGNRNDSFDAGEVGGRAIGNYCVAPPVTQACPLPERSTLVGPDSSLQKALLPVLPTNAGTATI